MINRILKSISRLSSPVRPIYLVGGALRNICPCAPRPAVIRKKLTGSGIEDFDFVLRFGALEIARKIAGRFNGRLVRLDEERRIFKVVVKTPEANLSLDFANFQGNAIEQDLSRRDFTMNAIALNMTNMSMIDPYSGSRDIRSKTIKAINEKNLAEDPLRTLRAFRFYAELGFTISPQTLKWIRKNASRIKRVSGERVRMELMKIMRTGSAARSLILMDEVRLLTAILRPLERSRNFARVYHPRGGVLGHMIECLECFEHNVKQIHLRLPKIHSQMHKYLFEVISGGFPRYTTLKLAALLHDIAKPHCAKRIEKRLRFFGHEHKGASIAAKECQRLRLSRGEIELISKAIMGHLRPGGLSEQPRVTDRALYRFFKDFDEDGVGVLLVALADHQSYMRKQKRWDKKERSVTVVTEMIERYWKEQKIIKPVKLVDGNDVMKLLKIPSGPMIGQILERIRSFQAEKKITTRSEALDEAKKFLAQDKRRKTCFAR
ncbi:CCA tRNA nucleotidyltransferase [Elusimicrobiota bacterium]